MCDLVLFKVLVKMMHVLLHLLTLIRTYFAVDVSAHANKQRQLKLPHPINYHDFFLTFANEYLINYFQTNIKFGHLNLMVFTFFTRQLMHCLTQQCLINFYFVVQDFWLLQCVIISSLHQRTGKFLIKTRIRQLQAGINFDDAWIFSSKFPME